MKLTVKITKEILKESMMCGTDDCFIAENCAVTKAIKDFFPLAKTEEREVFPFWRHQDTLRATSNTIRLPRIATDFIIDFDSLSRDPEQRLLLPEFSFEIDVPDEVINQIGLKEVEKILSESKTLSMVC